MAFSFNHSGFKLGVETKDMIHFLFTVSKEISLRASSRDNNDPSFVILFNVHKLTPSKGVSSFPGTTPTHSLS